MSTKKPAAKAPLKTTTKAAPKGAASKTTAKPAAGKGTAAKAPAPAAAKAPKAEPLPVEEISLKEINVVLNDSKGLIKASGRWPLVIDEAERVGVFLRHRDCNNLHVMDSAEMRPDSIRLALLGAIRYGKPMTINLGENGSIDIVQEFFNEVMPDLMDLVLTKQILEDDRYMKLVRPTDDADYTQNTLFAVGEGFNFVFLTANPTITEDTMGKVIVFKVA
ncbi:IQ motif and ankyrin repeat domain-containing protein 1-like [Babylonia areolata]|uniref:IQ motif and ankyrin repeat domain-containing protein 1-like n=1 Tax=Babylonia areolata TaxID=304850 RepID=UPI003FD6B897